MTIPFMYVVLWISIFGNRAIDYILHAPDGREFAEITLKIPELGFYHLLQEIPGGTPIILLATAVGFLFYVTSADSGALVMANLCSHLPTPTTDARSWLRIFWASITGVLTIGMLLVGGIPALQSASVIMGLPFAFVIAFTMAGFYKEISQDAKNMALRPAGYRPPVGVSSNVMLASASWHEWLAQIFGTVSPAQAQNYLDRVVYPALETLVGEMNKQGDFSVRIVRGEDDHYRDLDVERTVYDHLSLRIENAHGEFFYRVASIDAPALVYGTQIPTENDRSTRLEVHTSSGDEPYDIMGYSGEAIIYDVLGQYERYARYTEMMYGDPASQ